MAETPETGGLLRAERLLPWCQTVVVSGKQAWWFWSLISRLAAFPPGGRPIAGLWEVTRLKRTTHTRARQSQQTLHLGRGTPEARLREPQDTCGLRADGPAWDPNQQRPGPHSPAC